MPFLFLGAAHARATPLRPDQRAGLSPSDPELAAAMTRAWLRLSRRTTLWLAWVGFNFSHSLGAVAFGAFVVLIGRSAESYAAQAWIAAPLAAVVAAAYLVIGLKYWFRIPIAGCALSLILYVAAWASAPAAARSAPEPRLRPYLVALSVGNLDVEADWYQRVLGLRRGETQAFPEQRLRLVFLDGDGLRIELVELQGSQDTAGRAANPARARGPGKFAFRVDDLAGTAAALKALGAEVVFDWTDASRAPADRSLIVRDAEGNWVQFFEAPRR